LASGGIFSLKHFSLDAGFFAERKAAKANDERLGGSRGDFVSHKSRFLVYTTKSGM
jgi:hypothetical protein